MKRITAVIICMLILVSACAGGIKQESKGFGKSDLNFELNGKVFALNSDVKALLTELGDSYEFSEAPSCVYEGTDKTYEYAHISIYTYPVKDKDHIDEIVLTGSSYKTVKSIRTGSTLEEVVAAYGNNYKDEGGMITYRLEPDNMKSPSLYFVVEDGVVSSISYYSASNIIN